MKRLILLAIAASLAAALTSCIQIQLPTSAQTQAPQTAAPVPATPLLTPTVVLSNSAVPSATPAATSATPAPADTPAPSGVTEKALGFIKQAYVKDDTAYIVINYVEMYFGQEAIDKALEDHSDMVYKDENGNYTIDNDYYIRDNNPKLRTFALSADCTIRVIDMSSSGSIPMKKVDFQKLISLVKARDYEYLMHISVVNGAVASMEEQYLP